MMNTDDTSTELCKLAYKYGTDKCPQLKHTYTPFYYQLWKNKRDKVKKILEIGIGHYKGMPKARMTYDPGLRRYYHRGASLKMWRDFFPNALVFGADIQPETMFEGERIKTYLCNEREQEDLLKLIKNAGSDIDIFIDDASHHVDDQIFTCLTLMPLLGKGVTYIIEDAAWSRRLVSALSKYDCSVPSIVNQNASNQLVVVKHK